MQAFNIDREQYVVSHTYFTVINIRHIDLAIILIVFVLLMLEVTIGNNTFYIETLGMLSAIAESAPGIPQFYRNCKLKSTEGLSYCLL